MNLTSKIATTRSPMVGHACAAAAVALLCGLSSAAHAAWVYDTLPGAACQVEGSGNPASLRRTVSGAINTGTSPLSVICPVLRTIVAPTTGYRVYVNGFGLRACRFASMANTGGLLASVAMTGTDAGKRVTGLLPMSVVPELSHQSIVCTLPPGGGIYSVEFVQ